MYSILTLVNFILVVASLLTGRDPDCVKRLCRPQQQFTIAVEAAGFLLLLAWIFIQFSHAFDSYLTAVIATLLIGCLDYSVGRSMHAGMTWKIYLRVAVALVVSSTLALGFLISENGSSLDSEAKVMRAEAMGPLLTSHNSSLQQDRADIIGTRQKTYDAALAAGQSADAKLLAVQRARNSSGIRLQGYLTEAGDQSQGFGERAFGCGEICQANQRRALLEQERITTLGDDIKAFQLEAQQARNTLTEASKQLEAGNRLYEQKEIARNAELKLDPRYIAEPSGDYASRFIALTSLIGKPGGVSFIVTFLSKLLLFVLLDLAYLAMRASSQNSDEHPHELQDVLTRELQANAVLAAMPGRPPAPLRDGPRSVVRPIHSRPPQNGVGNDGEN